MKDLVERLEAGETGREMGAVEQLSRVFPSGWGKTKSQWRRGGYEIAFDSSPFAYHPPETAQDIVSGRLSHPIADQVRNLQPGESVTIPERTFCDMQPEGAELFSAMLRWAMRDGRYDWEHTVYGDMIIRRHRAALLRAKDAP